MASARRKRIYEIYIPRMAKGCSLLANRIRFSESRQSWAAMFSRSDSEEDRVSPNTPFFEWKYLPELFSVRFIPIKDGERLSGERHLADCDPQLSQNEFDERSAEDCRCSQAHACVRTAGSRRHGWQGPLNGLLENRAHTCPAQAGVALIVERRQHPAAFKHAVEVLHTLPYREGGI
jgi:hypothetical protein